MVSTWYQRIRKENNPDETQPFDYLNRSVNRFYEIDVDLELAFVTRFSFDTAFVKVYNPDHQREILQLIGSYNIGELERFKSDYANRTIINPTGSLEQTSNLIVNGLFNNLPDPLYAWEIDSDSGGQATISGVNNRLVVSSAVTSTVVIRNSETVLNNLKSYQSTISIFDLLNGPNVTLRIGSQDGTTQSVKGVYNETIVASGTEFFIVINFTSTDGVATIEYVLLGE